MTANRNDDCHNHLRSPVLSVGGCSVSSLGFTSEKEKMIELVEEILGTREVLVASRAM